MQLFVRTPAGACLSYDVQANASVEAVKAMVEDSEFVSGFSLAFGGKQLHTGSLLDAGIVDADTLEMHFSMKGGMRAKWRKKRMRRLRRKRRKMRQRAR